MEYLLLIVGFVLLVKGADVFVTGAASIAKKFNIPDLIIGLTIVAFATSAPEIAVSTVASLGGQNEMAISNIIGSNIFNMLVVLGACAVIAPIHVQPKVLKKEFPFAIITQVILLIMLADVFLGNGDINVLSRADGLILLIAFTIFMIFVVKSALAQKDSPDADIAEIEEEVEEVKVVSTGASLVMIAVGIAAVILGGDLVVDSASTIAYSFGLSETLVGLTIVAFGTSLPELVTSVVACKKGSSDMALGNVIGSNIFNVLLTLGLCSIISPITINVLSIYDAFIVLGFSIITYIMCFTGKKISKIEGFGLLAMYAAYTVYIIVR